MDPGTITGICIVLIVAGLVFWLPVLVFFPLIKSIADRIAGKSSETARINALQDKVKLLEHEVSDLRAKTMLIEDGTKFEQQLFKKQPPG